VNGIHEVTGSIPVSSTNSDNDLAARRSTVWRAVSMLCLFLAVEARPRLRASTSNPDYDRTLRAL
jgi:hypothetical protein